MEEIKLPMEHYTERGLDLNPDFQRGHVWTQSQQTDYVEYILRGGKSGKEIYFNQPGWGGNYNGTMVIVDGKQRLEAARAFLNDEIKAFDTLCSEFEDRKWMLVSCDFLFNVNNLKTRADVLRWYLEMNTGGTPHSKEEIKRVEELYEESLRSTK